MLIDKPVLVPKIMRVILEFGDRILYIEGEEAERWDAMIKQQALIANRSGYTPPRINWQSQDKELDEEVSEAANVSIEVEE